MPIVIHRRARPLPKSGGAPAGDTDLATAAAALTSGSIVDFSGRGMTTTLLNDSNGVSITQFCNRGVIDITHNIAHIVGGAHDGSGKWISYDDEANTWLERQSGIGDAYIHGYEHPACDLAGNVYFRGYSATNVFRAAYPDGTFGAAWDTVDGPSSVAVASALGWHRARDELVFFDSASGIYTRSSAGVWTERQAFAQDRYHTGCAYQPKTGRLFFGGGTSGTIGSSQQLYVIDTDGSVTQLNNTPVPWGPAASGADQALLVADPGAGGEMLLIASDGNIYERDPDPDTDTWSVIDTHPWFGGDLATFIEWPQTGYGVLMAVEGDAAVSLYKR